MIITFLLVQLCFGGIILLNCPRCKKRLSDIFLQTFANFRMTKNERFIT